MATMLHRKFPLGERCNCREIVIREVNGIDEQEAALRADMRGKRSSIYAELVRLAIVEVDGKRVEQPFLEIEQWNMVTRTLVRSAFDSINDLEAAELETFLAASVDVTPTTNAVTRKEANG